MNFESFFNNAKDNFFTLIVSLLIGVFFILNQFGPLINELLNLSFLKWAWEINNSITLISNGWLLSFLLFLSFITYVVLNGNKQIQHSYIQGISSGFLFLPLISIVLVLIGVIIWLAWKIIQLIGIVMWYISIPFVWIFNNIISPVLQFIATPFVWIFNNIISPVLQFIATPFVWIFNNIISPVLQFIAIPFVWIFNNIILPVLQFLAIPFIWVWDNIVIRLGSLILLFVFSGICIFPIAGLGQVIIMSFQMSLKNSLTPAGAFFHGVGLGFICFDALLLYFLSNFVPSPPTLTLVATLVIPMIFFLRLLNKKKTWEKRKWEVASYEKKVGAYWRKSKLEAIAMVLLIPASAMSALLLHFWRSLSQEGET